MEHTGERKTLEPTSGLEPLTGRLRMNPVLRMLLCDKIIIECSGLFLGFSGDRFVQQWYNRIEEPISGRPKSTQDPCPTPFVL